MILVWFSLRNAEKNPAAKAVGMFGDTTPGAESGAS
jgi:hypothetical protein